MWQIASLISLVAAAWVALATATDAASLRVAPVLIDAFGPTRAATVTIRNEGASAVAIQARVFRWRQKDGGEQLEATKDVVASPPIGTIPAGAENIVRVVRVAADAVAGEESYRLVIDELPDSKDRKPGVITLLVRHSIPLFFSAASTTPSRLRWSAQMSGGQYVVSATNDGAKRVRIADFSIRSREGQQLVKADGLVGYVLPGSTMRWRFRSDRGSYSGAAGLVAHSESGLINEQVAIGR